MAHAVAYSFQHIPLGGSERKTLRELDVGGYTLAREGKMAVLFARTALNFGIVTRILPNERKPNIEDHLYTRISKDRLLFEEVNNNRLKLSHISFGQEPTADIDRLITRLILQENGGWSCNETKRIEIMIHSRAYDLPLPEGFKERI